MRSVKTFLIMLLVLGAVIMVAGQSANAQSLKIGYVLDTAIQTSYKAWQRANDLWETERKAWDTEGQNKQQELQDLIAEYEKQRLILSDEKKKEREAAIRTKQEALDAYTRHLRSGRNGRTEAGRASGPAYGKHPQSDRSGGQRRRLRRRFHHAEQSWLYQADSRRHAEGA